MGVKGKTPIAFGGGEVLGTGFVPWILMEVIMYGVQLWYRYLLGEVCFFVVKLWRVKFISLLIFCFKLVKDYITPKFNWEYDLGMDGGGGNKWLYRESIPSHTPGSDEQEQFDFDHVIVGKQKSLWDFHDLDL